MEAAGAHLDRGCGGGVERPTDTTRDAGEQRWRRVDIRVPKPTRLVRLVEPFKGRVVAWATHH
eukprot:SAG11_NODE_1916_length_4071_cov_3.418429_4_plen_63_part_00